MLTHRSRFVKCCIRNISTISCCWCFHWCSMCNCDSQLFDTCLTQANTAFCFSWIPQKCYLSSDQKSLSHVSFRFFPNSPGMMQACLWMHYHEKVPPTHCTYLTSDLPFVPPRQQIAVVVVAGSSVLDCHSCPRAWCRRVGGCLSIKLFNAKVNSHAPPSLQKHTPSHTLPHS